MWPWMWIFYAPTYRLPWGGDWQQSVDTSVATARSSKNPALEHTITTEVASYGRQIGWINDVLLAQQSGAKAADRQRADASLQSMRETGMRIQALKDAEALQPRTDAKAQAQAAALRLKAVDPAGFAELKRFIDAAG